MKLQIKQLLNNTDIIGYIFFGALTTLVNYAVYGTSYYYLHLGNVVSTCIAWLLAVAFAFITNKLWVFESKGWHWEQTMQELIGFIGCRAVTGFIELGLMYLTVDVWKWHPMIMKIVVNVFVIAGNYIASKFFIFTGKDKE